MSPPPKPASILLVDDRPANLLALDAILEPLGQRLVKAHSGQEALKCLLDDEFALILMDVQMPGLDGIETARLIRKRERTRSVPIIFLTAISRDPSHVFAGYAEGGADYLMKPFAPEILRSKVSVFVELYRSREKVRWQGELLREREREVLEQESERRFRHVTEALPLSLFTTDANGVVTYANRAWHEYSGLTEEETLRPECYFAIVHPEDREQLEKAWARAVADPRRFEYPHRMRRNKDGAYRWHLTLAEPDRDDDGNVIGWIATSTDIHDQKMAVEMAESANRAKDEFLATVSHELRTPLNAMLGWARLLRAGQLDREAVPRALETIERNAKVQVDLIEDILDVARIVSGKIRCEPRPIDLAAVVDAAVESARPIVEAKGLTLDVSVASDGGLISGDAGRLQQVLWNLLSNAVKFTPRGGRIAVRLSRSDGEVAVSVSDTGCGISREFLPHVFDRFRQADSSSTRSHGGLGLGLSLVHHLVELHAGTVEVNSDGQGQGATFTVRLPSTLPAPAPLPAPQPAERPRASSRGRSSFAGLPAIDGVKVLVVDDEADARELLAAVLDQFGARVTSVGSPTEALEAIARAMPDVLLSDIAMPSEDGYSLIRRVRALDPAHGGLIPAVALTGFARHEDQVRAIDAGFQRHLAKPIEPAELIHMVASLVAAPRA